MASLRKSEIFYCLLIMITSYGLAGEAATSRLHYGTVLGYVTDAEDKIPLRDVNIFFAKTTLGDASDEKGYFEIKRIPTGTYTLIAKMIGYRPLVVHNVRIGTGAVRRLNIKLNKQAVALDSVQISASRLKKLLQREISNVGHEIISPRMAVQQPGVLDDAYRSMRSLPGVASRNDLNTQLYIRGGSPDQNLILYDGIEILTPSRLFVVMGGGMSLVNPDVIESIDLAPGGFDVEYGNKMSALVNLNSRNGRTDRLSVRSSASLITARTVIEGPIFNNGSSWLLAGRRSFYDVLANSVNSENYIFPFFFDIHSKLNLKFGPDQNATVFYSHLGEGARLYDVEGENLDLLNKGAGNIFGVKFTSVVNPNVFANLTMGYYDDKNSVKIYDTFNYNFNALLNYHVRRTSARSEIEYYPAKWLMLKTGVQFSFNKTDLLWSLDWRNYVNLPDYINFNEKYFSNGVYWKAKFRYQNWFEIIAGLRYDYSTLFNVLDTSPRVKARVGLLPNLNLFASMGKYSQFPDIMTVIGRGEPLDITRNIHSLRPEYAIHTMGGLAWQIADRFEAKFELYHKKLQDILIGEEENFFVPENIGSGFAEGVELSVKRIRLENEKFGFWINYGYSSSRYRRPGDLSWRFFDYDQRHRCSVGSEIQFYKFWTLSAEYHYGTGFPYTPISAMRRSINGNSPYLEGWDVLKDEKNSGRYPDYHRLDLRFAYRIHQNGKGVSAYLDLINVFNHRTVYLYEWDYYSGEGSSGSAKRSVIYMLPFIPSFGVNINL